MDQWTKTQLKQNIYQFAADMQYYDTPLIYSTLNDTTGGISKSPGE